MPLLPRVFEAQVRETESFSVWDESSNSLVVGGNKIRKLSAILKETEPAGLLTYGSRYSSHCTAAAYWAAARGIPARLLVIDDDPVSAIDAPSVRFCSRLGAEVVPVASLNAKRVIAEERVRFKHYRWIEGGGHEVSGAEAYRLSFGALIERNPSLRSRDWVALALGTGTTALGIAQAVADKNLNLTVFGVSVARTRERCVAALSEFGWDTAVNRIRVLEDFSGKYGKVIGDEALASEWMVSSTGLLPDPVYNVRVAQFLMRHNMSNGIIVNTGGQQNYYLS